MGFQMNLYKSLLLSAVVVTSFSAVSAEQDPAQQPDAQPTGNILTRAKEAFQAEFDRGVVSWWSGEHKELATNKLVIGASVATVAVAGAGTYLYLKNRQKPTETTVQESQEVAVLSTITVEGSPELTITDLGDGKAMLKHENFDSTITFDVNAVDALKLAIAELSLAIANETE